MDGEVYIHLHISLSNEENHAFGGHLTSAVISGTCELYIRVVDGEVGRYFDKEVGLNLYEL